MPDIRNWFSAVPSAKQKKEKEKQKEPLSPGKRKQNGAASSKAKKRKSRSVPDDEDNNNDNRISKELKSRNGCKETTSLKQVKRKKIDVSSDEESFESESKPSKQKKTKRGVILDSDSDEDPLPAKQRKKKEVTVVLDSEEDEQASPPKKGPATQVSPTKKGPAVKVTPSKKKKEEEKKKTPINVSDFFGGGEIHRKERRTPSKKEDPKPEEDYEIHDDSDFEETLRALDDSGHVTKKEHFEPNESHSTCKKGSLASKLSEKIKQEVVPETPEKKTPSKNKKKEDKIYVKDTPPPAKVDKPPAYTKKASPSLSTPDKGKSSPTKASPSKTSPTSNSRSPGSKGEDGETPHLERKNTGYRAYLTRDGPRALGSKEIPEGGENCLEGLTFVITGVLESLERDEAKTLVEKYGGKVTGSVSKKTSYIVLGRDPGESKAKKAKDLGTKQIDEDGLLDLIRTLPGKKSKYTIAAEAEAKKAKAEEAKAKAKKVSPAKSQVVADLDKFRASSSKSPKIGSQTSQSSFSSQRSERPEVKEQAEASLLWVDKYKPTSLAKIIGQQGDKSCAKKLLYWLKNWHKSIAAGKKPVFSKFNNDGTGYRAALLSGPPGVGKTTTATLVCEELGFSFIELNASDSRSKKLLQEEVSEALGSHTLVDFFGKNRKDSSHEGHRHCLVMDEVDGMAGNEDRGGVQELIQLIKKSKIPIICMCNDRQHPKVRSLANHCFDLRFQRPRMEQIKSAMMTIACREGLKIPPNAMNEIIGAANQDVRQVIHNLSMWSAREKALTYEQLKEDANKAKKDMKIGPFDVCRMVFAGGEEKNRMSIHDKTGLFFNDYSIGPLFVQENYLSVTPYEGRGDKKKHLQLISKTADSLVQSDLLDRCIRRENNWSLLPMQAIFASVLPGEYMKGTMGGMINFPSWLGKNSSRSKTDRQLQELKMHMRLHVSGAKQSLNQEYLPHLRHALTRPLIEGQQEGIPEVVQLMDDYDLLREDVDSIMEVTKWPNRKDPMSCIDSKVKGAFTRAYNKESHMMPYAISGPAKKSRRGAATSGEGELDEEGNPLVEESDEDNKDDASADAMIKKKTAAKSKGTDAKKGKEAKGKTSAKGGSSKGKGKKR